MGTTSGWRDGLRQPRALVAEWVFGRREPNLKDQVAGATAPFRPGTDHPGGNRKAPWPKALRDVACVAKPDTILAWYRRLLAQKFDGFKHRQYPGRPPISSEVEALAVRMARVAFRHNAGLNSECSPFITISENSSVWWACAWEAAESWERSESLMPQGPSSIVPFPSTRCVIRKSRRGLSIPSFAWCGPRPRPARSTTQRAVPVHIGEPGSASFESSS